MSPDAPAKNQASIAVVMDNACDAILNAQSSSVQVTQLRVNPAIYEAVATSRARELRRGNPLLVLALELRPDPTVALDTVELT